MTYVKSPSGIYHQVANAMRTACGERITGRWREIDGEPSKSSLSHTCRRCIAGKDHRSRTTDASLYDAEERRQRKIRKMQQDLGDAPKIGE